MNPAEWLVRSARRAPHAPALLLGKEVVADYTEFQVRAAAIAGAMTSRHGITHGDRVAIFMSNRTEYLELLYGIWFAGAAAVPINAKLHPREAAWILDNAEAKLVFVSDDVGNALKELSVSPTVISVDHPGYAACRQATPLDAPVQLQDDDMLWLFYTSGTTGTPKGVMLSARNLQAMTFAYLADVDDVSPQDAFLYAAPISHGAGLYNFVGIQRGARHVVPETGRFDVAEILALADKLGNISMFAAPTMVKRLVEHAKANGSRGDGLKTIVYGGGPMYLADIVEAVDVLGPKFVQIYGQGESPMTITALSRELVADRAHPRWRERAASVGLPHSCVQVRVVDADGNDVPVGEVGEILVQGATVMGGYWRNEQATTETVRDGWLWTGDTGALDEDGFLTLHDRSKDVIISGGANVYPREVEETLLLHATVREVAVVGRAHPDWGEEVVAFVVPVQDASLDEQALDAHCLDHIARFKRPKAYFLTEELPKNNYGKVLKTALREQLDR
ncbi:MAG: AMP-binding protein [Hyphomicrobiaceae bacterium]|nr:AMP-binding protein [Hyphomicrobiaceae bacterium]